MWEILIFSDFATENSNKFQKTRFWKEKSVEDMVTLECLPFNSSRRNCEGKIRNVARKNKSQLKFVVVNS
jgi:hypothetical protein